MSAARKVKPRTRKRRRKPGPGRSPLLWRWLLGAALVVVIVGVGLLKWTETRKGQAALLTMGSQKMYSEVQATVEQALVPVLPSLPRGPRPNSSLAEHDPGDDIDWPDPGLGQGAAIRCRRVPVPAGITFWALQDKVEQALAPVGARVLWGERLFSPRRGSNRSQASEDKDILRLDVGVSGRPTHTLLLYREGSKPKIHWGGGPNLSHWEALVADDRPTIALVIDDWGNNTRPATSEILALDIPLTMSVLPGRPFSRHFALKGTELVLPPQEAKVQAANNQGTGSGSTALRLATGCPVMVEVGPRQRRMSERRREIILHLPMEPRNYPEDDPGQGALMVGMKTAEIADLLTSDLKGYPVVAGLNNHMGSAATSDPATMAALMQVLKKRDLFFLDSLTTSHSVAYAEARKVGLRALRNRTFLDYDQENPIHIKANLGVLVQAARHSGMTVGIGHPYPQTAAVLAREIPRLKKEGIRFVTLSEMLALQAAVGQSDSQGRQTP